MNTEGLAYLLEQYFYDRATHAERESLFRALEDNPDIDQWEALLLRFIPHDQPQAGIEEKYERLLRSITATQPRVRKMRRRYAMWAAASVILVLGAGIYFYTAHNKKEPVADAISVKDIPAPQTSRAMITLADGSTVYLDSAGNGQLAQLGNVKLVKLANGQIAYQTEDASTPSHPGEGPDHYRERGEAYNTLTNPRGSKVIDMTLSDGSHVWLNAGSSITYPVAFTGNERKVTMTGEAYFEIVPLSFRSGSRSLSGGGEAKKPFIVQKGDMQVTVLGTHFNVNAYDNENDIKVTLLEGSVRVESSSPPGAGPDRYREGGRPEVRPTVTLKPGQQAQLKNHGNHSITKIMVQTVDLEQVMAWKNGLFRFDKTGIQEVMRQISRWYDVEVSYPQGVPTARYWGSIRRDQSLAEVFRVLQESGAHFRIEAKKVIVLP